MRIEQRSTALVRRDAPETYFVGRRLFEAAEVFSVAAADLERLRSARRYGGSSLDWHGGEVARMELGYVIISRVAEGRPSRELVTRFALYVLDRLPDGGFVLNSDDVWGWLQLATVPGDFIPEPTSRPSFTDWLRSRSRRDEAGSSYV